MAAQTRYITSLLSVFSTFLENLNVSRDLALLTTEKFIVFTTTRKKSDENWTENWQVSELEKFITTQNVPHKSAVLMRKFITNYTPLEVDVYLHEFLTSIKADNRSDSTIKNYRSDIQQFANIAGRSKLQSLFDPQNLRGFVQDQLKNGLQVSTIKRKLSSISQFALWAETEKIVTDASFWISDMESLIAGRASAHSAGISGASAHDQNSSGTNKTAAQELEDFLISLEIETHSDSTIKNYKSDIGQFLEFTSQTDLQKIVSQTEIEKFVISQKKLGLKISSIKRKVSSISQFALWAENRGAIRGVSGWIHNLQNQLFEIKPQETSSLAAQTHDQKQNYELKLKPATLVHAYDSKPQHTGWSLPVPDFASSSDHDLSNNHGSATTHTSASNHNHAKKIAKENQTVYSGIKANLQEFANQINTKRNKQFLPYLNLVMLFIFAIGLGILGYQQFIVQAPTPFAYPTSPVRPNRELSFQGRLTDTAQNPITDPTDMAFRLYDTGPGTGGTQLWSSGTCSVTPDQDGIFNVGLGDDCGSEITQDVFTENSNVWLEVEIEAETLDPRQSIKTVAYALNSETVQGYPVSATGAATTNTILTMDAGGQVLLGEVSPKLKSTSGTFAIEAQTLMLQTSAGSNGNITLNPDGTGKVIVQSNLDLEGYLHAPGATFSATYAGGVSLITKGGPSGTANIQEWQNSGASKLATIDELGNFAVGSQQDERFHMYVDRTTATNVLRRGYFSQLRVNTAAEAINQVQTGVYGKVYFSTGGNTLSSAYGVTGEVQNNTSNALTSAIALSAATSNTSTGTISSAYGLNVSSFGNSGGGTITDAYGIYVSNQNVATNNYAILTNAGNIVFNEGGDASTDFRVEGDTDANLLFTDASTDRIGIGTSSPGYKLDVTGEANFTDAIRAGGDAGSTGYLLTSSAGGVNTWTDPASILSSGYWANTLNVLHPKNEYANVVDLVLGGTSTASADIHLKSNGQAYFGSNVGIGTTTPTSQYLLDVRGNLIVGNQGASSLTGNKNLYINNLTTDTTTTNYNIASSLDVNPATDTTRIYMGGYYNVDVVSGNTATFSGRLVGLQGQVDYRGTGSVTQARGIAGIVNSHSTGTITTAYGGYYGIYNNSTGTITNAHSLYVVDGTNAGTVTSKTGLTIAGITNATNTTDILLGTSTIPTGNFALYSSSSRKSYFGGNVGIGSTNPQYALDVAGALRATRTITSYDNTYIVDRNGGGDFTTIAAAVAQINTNADTSVSNPYTIIVMNGTYDEDVTVPNYTSIKGQGYYSTIIDGRVTIASGTTIEDLRISPTGSETIAVLANPSVDTSYLQNTYVLINNDLNSPTYAVSFTGTTDFRIYNTFIYGRNPNAGGSASNYILRNNGGTGDLEVHVSHLKSSCANNSNCNLALNDATAAGSDVIVTGSSWSVFNDAAPVGAVNNNASGQIKIEVAYENDSSDYTTYSITGANVVNAPIQTGSILASLGSGFTSGSALGIQYHEATTLSSSLTGASIDLSTNITASNQDIIGVNLVVPNSGSGTSKGINLSGAADYGLYLAGETSNYLSGNLGIGTTTANYKLDVTGEANFTDAIRAGGNAGTTGYFLTSSAGGVNTWTDPASILSSGYWANTLNVLHPKNEYASIVDLVIGGTSTASADIQLKANGQAYFGGNVGIGSTAPGAKLDIVSGTSYADIGIQSTGGFKVRGDGRVDIGSASGQNALLSVNRTTGNSVADLAYLGNADGLDMHINSSTTVFSQSISGATGKLAFGNSAVNSQQMVLDTSTGNVGIGTSTPVSKLSVVGTRGAFLDTEVVAAWSGLWLGAATMTPSASNYNVLSDGTSTIINRPTGGNIYFRESNATQVTLLTGGNVGIGTTTATQKLEVAGNTILSGATPTLYLADTNNYIQNNGSNLITKTSGSYYFRNTGNTDKLSILSTGDFNFSDNSAANILTIKNSGNIGVGTSTPLFKLDVAGTASVNSLNINDAFTFPTVDGTADQVLATNGSGTISWASVLTDSPSVGAWSHGDHFVYPDEYWADDLIIGGNSTASAKFRVGATDGSGYFAGNVGIGTSAPGYKLSIGSADTTQQIGIYHDNTNATFTTTTGVFKFITDAGTNTDSSIRVYGKGTGIGGAYLYDQDNAEALYMSSSSNTGQIEVVGTSPSTLELQGSANANLGMFRYSTDGETRELNIYGYRTADANRSLQIGVGIDAADTASFDGVSNYYFDGNVGIGTTGPTAKLDILQNVSAIPANIYGQKNITNSTGIYTAGTANIYGLYSNASATGVSTGGTQNTYGGYFSASGNNTGAGISNAYGLYVNGASGADNNYSAAFMNGNVGIGTTIPGSNLEVANTSNAYITSKETTYNSQASFTAYSLAANYPRGVFQIGQSASDVNVALAVVPKYSSAGVNKSSLLFIGNNSNFGDSGYKSLYMNTGTTGNSVISTAGQNNSGNGGTLSFGTNPGALALTINSDDIGIGTTIPSTKLDVRGGTGTQVAYFDGRVRGEDAVASDEFITLSQLTTGTGQYWSRTGTNLSPTTAGDDIYLPSGSILGVGYDPTTISGGVAAFSGNVGIGTSAPGTKLQVTPSSFGEGTGLWLGTRNTGGYTGLAIDLSANVSGYSSIQSITNSGAVPTYGTIALNPNGGNVGIGIATPQALFDSYGDSFANTNRSATKEFVVAFPNGVADQKFDLYMTGTQSFWGSIEVEVSSGYSNQNASGNIKKVFGVGLNPGGTIFNNESRYSEESGTTADSFAISDISWDATNSRYKIAIVHRTSTGNTAYVKVKAVGNTSAYRNNFLTMTSGSIYTTDTTTYARPEIYYNGNVGIGTSSPSYDLDVNSGTNNGIGIGSSARKKTLTWDSLTSPWDALNITSNGATSGWRGTIDLEVGYSGGTAYPGLTVKANTDGTTANVGIGSITPGTTLDVTGTGRFSSTLTLNGVTAGTDNTVLVLNSSNQVIQDEIDARVWGTSLVDGSGTANYISKFSNADTLTNSLLYDNGTNVGIGVTSPMAKLDIAGTSSAGRSLLLRSGDSSVAPADSNQILFGYANSNDYMHSIRTRHNAGGDLGNAIDFYVWDAGTDAINNTPGTNLVMSLNGGNMGIGTDTPSYKLDVQNGTGIVGRFSGRVIGADAVNTNEFVTKSQLDGVSGALPTATEGYTLRGSGSSWQANSSLFIKSDGNVGIGTTLPAQKLHLGGTTSNLQVDGDLVYGNQTASYKENYVKNSSFESAASPTDVDDWTFYGAGTVRETDAGRSYIKTSGIYSFMIQDYGSNDINDIAGKTFNISADVKNTTGNGSLLFYGYVMGSNPRWISWSLKIPSTTGEWQRLVGNPVTFAAGDTYISQIRFYSYPSSNDDTIYVDNIKLDEATYATIYTEDNKVNNLTIPGRLRTIGNVGIGSTSPTQKLDVLGNLKFSGALMPNNLAGTAGQVLSSAGAGVAPTWTTLGADSITADSLDFTEFKDAMTLDASTSVAFGASNYTFNLNSTGNFVNNLSSTGDFIIQDAGVAFATFADDGSFTLDNLKLDGNTISSVTSGGITLQPLSGQNLNVSLATTGDFAVNTNQLYVDTSAGNVGIGTSSPVSKLNVYQGDLQFSDPQYDATISVQNLTSGSLLTAGDLNVRAGSSTGGGSMGGGKLVLSGGNGFTGGSGGGGNVEIKAGYNTYSDVAHGSITFHAGNAQPERMRITSTGNVGIGVTPSNKLEVAAGNIALDTSGTGTYWVGANSNQAYYPHRSGGGILDSAGSFTINIDADNNDADTRYFDIAKNNNAVSGTSLLRILENGNVGIGSTAPGYALDLVGEFNLTDAIRVAGNAGTSGYLLTSSGGGANTWTDPASIISGSTWWANTLNVLHPKNEYASIADLIIGGTATASADIHLLADGSAVFNQQGTSTADFRVESDTDANALFVQSSTNNVGIGTNTPGRKLDVAGDIELANYLYFGNAGTEYLRWDGSDFILSDDFLPAADGGQNLGSSSMRWESLFVKGASIHIGDNGDEAIIGYDTTNDRLTFDANGDATAEMRVDATGNVGIGTTGSLSARLHVYSSTLDNVASFRSSDDLARFEVRDDDTGIFFNAKDGYASIGGGNSLDTINLNINTTTGHVGIGTTAPVHGLEVNKAVTGRALVLLKEMGDQDILTASNSAGTTRFRMANTGIMYADSFADIGNQNYFVDPAGDTTSMALFANAGIGTTTPGARLDVRNTSTEDILNLFDGATEVMTVIDGGNVGIGSTGPAQKLVVNGNVQIGAAGYIDDDATMGETTDDWIHLNGYIELKSNTSSYGIVLREDNSTDYFGITQEGGYSVLADSNTSANYFLRGNGTNVDIVGNLGVGVVTASQKIDIVGGGIVIEDNSAASTNAYKIERGGTDYSVLWMDTDEVYLNNPFNNSMNFRTNSTTRLTIDSGGILYSPVTYTNTSSARDVYVDADGSLGYLSSSIANKTNVETIQPSTSDKIYDLRPVKFEYKDSLGTIQYGLIAEEVAQIIPEMAFYDSNGIPEGVSYQYLAPLLLSEVQKHQIKLNNLENNTITFDSIGSLILSQSGSEYTVTEIESNSILNTIIGARSAVIGILQTGITSTRNLIVENTASITNLTVQSLQIGGQTIEDYIVSVISNQGSGSSTALVSPIAGELIVDSLTTESITATGSSTLGNLLVENLSVTNNASVGGELTTETLLVTENATISGSLLAGLIESDVLITQNATVAGTLTANHIDVNSSRIAALEAGIAQLEHVRATTADLVTATVSGTLYADNIYDFENKVASTLQQPGLLDILLGTNESTASGNFMQDLYDTVNTTAFNASASADLDLSFSELSMTSDDVALTGTALFVEKYLKVNGAGYISDSLAVGNKLFVGETMQIADGLVRYTSTDPTNQILQIQPEGQGSIELLAGIVTIDDSGKVTVNGDLEVTGTAKVATLLTNMLKPADFGNPFQVQVAGVDTQTNEVKKSRFEIINEVGTPVATFSAEGNAEFAGKAEFGGGIGIASQNLGSSESNELTTDKTSGKATIKSGASDVTIKSNLITNDSLVYVTAVGSTGNQVIYVKSQTADDTNTPEQEGRFIVGFDNLTTTDVSFNWWIVN